MRRPAVLATLALACAVLPLGPGEAAAATAAPASCADAAPTNPVDGPVTLVVGSVAVPVWCADMATTPVEYLTLTQTAPGQNESFSPAAGAYGGTDATRRFQRVRLLLPTPSRSSFAVVMDDDRFATTTGSRYQTSSPGTSVGAPGYANAGDCAAVGSTAGRANADLRGTPFAVTPGQFMLYGYGVAGTTTLSAADQVLDMTGGGYCGSNAGTVTENGHGLLLLTLLPSVPVVVDQPTTVTTAAGAPATFTSTATGAPVVTTRWQTSADGGSTWTDVPGATGSTVTLSAPSAPGGQLLVRAVHSTSAGDTASAAVVLQAAALPPTPAPAPTPTPAVTPTAAAPELAATGVDPAPALGLGVALLVAGVGVLVAQRWRTTAGSAPTALSACTSSAPSGPSATV